MATQQEILREYLLALGFKVDQSSFKKFDAGVVRASNTVNALGKSAAAMGTAVTVAVGLFARQMERLYYSSVKAESAAGRIQGLEYGAKQIGISGDVMRSALEGMGRALRTNPGLGGLLESLGVRVTGRDRADVLTDMVAQLRKMPFYIASQYASLFGISPDDLLLLENGLEKMKEAARVREKMNEDAGLNMEQVAKDGVEYANQLDNIWAHLDVLKNTALHELLPTFKEIAAVTVRVLDDWVKITKEMAKDPGDVWQRLMEGLGITKPGGGVAAHMTPEARARIGMAPAEPPPTAVDRVMDALGYSKPASRKKYGVVTGAAGSTSSLFGGLEQVYGLPSGLLDKVWAQESNRGKSMLSPKGAKGHFGFMDATAAQYGVTDPNDLVNSATGAAKYLGELQRKYGGDLAKTLGAYNWGPGNVDRKGLGAAPAETQDYIRRVGGITINTTVTVQGGDSPEETGRAVGAEVARVNSEILRNRVGAHR
jgi:hypothetical protein